MSYQLVKSFASFRGLDLRNGDLTRAREFASSIDNCDFRSTAALSKRKGYQHKETLGGAGTSIWSDLNTTTGIITNKLVTADSTLRVKETGNIDLSYTGSGTAYVTISATGSSVGLNLYEDDTIVTTQNLGTGFESSPITMSALTTTLNGLTDFTASLTGTASEPAAFLDVTQRTNITTNTLLTFSYVSVVNSPQSAPFTTHWAARNDSDFEVSSFVTTNGVIYISNGKDELHKYDGQNLYRAGMPQGALGSATATGAGSVTNSGLEYMTVYYQVDNKGNIVEGKKSDNSASISVTSQSIDVVVNNIEASSGFNTNCALAAGTQSSVTTITVDDGSGGAHTLEAGDTAYFYDGVTADYITREVSSVTASSITISGAAVDIADNAVISNNLRVDIYRNKAAGTTMYLVASIPNNSFASTQTYTDNVADSGIGAEYVEPIKERGLPPKGRYITLFRNQLIVSGFDDDVDAVAYSDVDSPEYFPGGTNRFNVDTSQGDRVTGLKALNSVLYVFKGQSIHTLTGDLINDNFQVDILTTGGVGCVANATIQEVNGRLFFLDDEGVFSVTQGIDGAEEISEIISPEFDTLRNSFEFKRATAAYWLLRDKYVIYMPVIATNGANKTSATTSKVYAYDVYRGGWLKWSNIRALGGFAVLGEDLWFSDFQYNDTTSAVDRPLSVFLNTGTGVDYADHESAISATYKTHWESLGEPSMFKKFLRLKLHSLDATINDFETQLFTVDVTTEVDYSDVPVFTHTYDFGNGATGGWGENAWGTSPWGDARLSYLKTKLGVNKAYSMRITFQNDTINKNFLISGYELEVAAPFRPALKE